MSSITSAILFPSGINLNLSMVFLLCFIGLLSSSFEGLFILKMPKFDDKRGWLIKPYSEQAHEQHLRTRKWQEDFFSKSIAGVLRGFHFQRPPHDHEKLVMCLTGVLLDVLIDIRTSSKTYGKVFSTLLKNDGRCLFIPSGFAHAFYSLDSETLVYYKTTHVYSPSLEGGIRWDSVDFDWPTCTPIISDRDRDFPNFSDFDSPFR